MDAVTPGMRDQRRRRREAERADRGEIRRRPPTPHPAGLRAQGWTRPAPSTPVTGARLVGATTTSVAITDRATLSTARRASAPTALGPPPVTRGPLPAAASLPRPARFGPPARGPVAPPAEQPEPAAPPTGSTSAQATTTSDREPPAAVPTEAPTSVDPPAAAGTAAPAAPVTPVAPAAPAAPPPPEVGPVATPSGTSAPAATPPAPASATPTTPPDAATAPPGPTPPAAPLPSDLFAHALGLSPATAPAPPAAASGPGRHTRVGRRPRDPWADAGDRRPGRRLLVAAAVVVVLAGIGTAVGVTLAGRDDTSTTTTGVAAADAVVVDSATWLSGNVSPQQRIVASDATLAADLNRRGVPVDVVPDGTAPPSGAILVATSDDASPDAVIPVGRGSCVVLLADFSDAGRTVTVGEVVSTSASEVGTDLANAASTAASAAEGLRNNAAVRIATDLDPLFTSGRLDLRAATLLAAIAQDQQVEVVAAPQDRAESRAGRPVRTLVVSVQDTQAVREIAATARSPYAPDVEAARPEDGAPAGSLRLTWPAGAAITMPFQ